MIETVGYYLNERDTPAYPKFGPAVRKFHKLPRTRENVLAHAEALTNAVRSLQRAALNKALEPGRACPCASGTWHDTGKAILAAVNTQNRAALNRALTDNWKRRTDEQVGIALTAALEGRDAPLVHNIYVSRQPRR